MADFVTIANKTIQQDAGKTYVIFDICFANSSINGSKVDGAVIDLYYDSTSVNSSDSGISSPTFGVAKTAIWQATAFNSANGQIAVGANPSSSNTIIVASTNVTLSVTLVLDALVDNFAVSLQTDAQNDVSTIHTADTTTYNLNGGALIMPPASLADVVVDLPVNSDSGTLHDDNITNAQTPTVTVNLTGKTLAEGQAVQIIDTTNANAVVGSHTVTSQEATTGIGSLDITLSTSLSDGSHALIAKISTGSTAGTASTTATTVTIDTTAPTTTINGLALSADTGASPTDFITSSPSQTITGTLSAVLGSDKLFGSLDNGTTWTDITSKVIGTAISWDGATLSGSSTIKLEVRDAAGNAGTAVSQAYELDTASPTTTISGLHLSADTGTSNTDFITKTASQTITGTLSAALGNGEALFGSLDNGVTWKDITDKVSGTLINADGATLSGSNTIKVEVRDAAGNAGTPASQAYVLDTVAPTTTISGLHLSADKGISNTDFITMTASQTITGTLSAALAVGEKLYGSVDNGTSWLDITSKVSTTAISWDGATLSGSSTIKLEVRDAAGNAGTVVSQAYELDTASPTTTISGLHLSADTGISNTDFITKTALQTITGTLSAALGNGEALFGSLDNGVTWQDITDKVSGTSISADGATLSGSSTIKVEVRDTAGNAGTAASQAYVLDTVAPTTTISALHISSDTGTSSADFITRTADQTITGTLSAALAVGEKLYGSVDNGTSWLDITSKVSTTAISWDGATLSGSSTIKLEVRDAAGNAGTAVSQAYELDTTAPTSLASVVVDLKSTSDSGSSTTDDITSAITPTVTVPLTGKTLVTGDIVQIIDTSNGNAVVGTHTVTSQEATSGITTQDITLSTLAVGIHALKAQLTDLAGNAGTVSTTATAVTVDTAALSPTLALATDNGSNTSDGITNVGTVNVSGLETGATWEYRTTDSASWTLGTGNSFTLSAGTYAANNVQVRQTDAAGNVSSAGMITTAITVDTTVPVFTSPADGSVNENADVATIIYTALATDNATLTYSLSGTDANLLNINAVTGAVTLKTSADYESSQKSYSFTVSASDGANSADKAIVVSVTNVNEPHTGAATISGQPAVGATLTADISTLADQDGLTNITYQWQADGANISNATASSVVLDATQINLPITVKVTYTDSFGNTTVTSAAKVWNQAPVISVTNATVSLAENAAAGEIGVQATATDAESDPVTLSLVSPVNSTNDPLFAMDTATGKISLTAAGAAALDYETHTNYQVTITASDVTHTGASATTKVVTVNITDVNEAPTAVALNNAITSMAENTSTTTHIKVADIAVTDDALVSNNAVTLTGADANSFEVVGTALYLKAGETLNYEAKQSYALTVNVADSTVTGSSAVTTNYALTVTDVNEAPTVVVLNNATTSIAENTSTTTHIKVADIAVTDDAPGTNTVTLSGTDANSFEVVGTALYLKAGETLNYEAPKNSYTVTVNVSDTSVNGSSAVTTPYTLNVTNVNDLPTGLTIDGTLTEGQTVEAKNVADEDGLGSTFYYQWKAGSDVISGATSNTLLLDSSQVGKAITVKVSYTDGHGTPESISTTTTANVAASFKGVALDGYLSNALVWVDSNSDGKLNWNDTNSNNIWDQGETATESWTITDASGQFSGLVGTGKIMMTANPVTNTTTNLSGTQTRDISTGKPFTGSYSAPAGSTVVNPLTTLVVAEMARSTSDASTAAASVKTALGLDTIQNLDLTTYDALAETVKTGGDDASAIKVQSAATQVANIMDIATSVAEGASSTKTAAEIAQSVATSLMATANSGTLDVTNTTVINDAITDTVAGVNAAVVSSISDASAAVNSKISTISNSSGTPAETLTQIVAAQLVAQETLAGQAKTAVQTTNTGAVTVSAGNIDQAVTDKVDSVKTIIPNYLPTGDVTITGAVTQGHTLTVSNTLADIDGIPANAIHYQWLENGDPVSGATGVTYTLTANDVDKQISVVASYTDGAGHSNSKVSSVSPVLAQHAPTGSVTITGTVINGHALAASHNIVDADGPGSIIYQWYSGSTAISEATLGNTLVLSNAQEGDAISVKASYVDGHGTAESVSSDTIPYGATLSEITHVTTVNELNNALGNLLMAFPSSDFTLGTDVEEGIAAYYNSLATATDVVVRSVIVTAAGTLDVSASAHEALVIDITAVPPDSVLNLNNVDFAIIIGNPGNVTIRGGAGNNIVFAGSGHQDIVLGPGNDILHGGDGDDYIGSLAGNDQLYGDADNDTLTGGTGDDTLDGGTGDDTAVFSHDFSKYTISFDGTHYTIKDTTTTDSDGTDLVSGVEHFQFADVMKDVNALITTGADPYAHHEFLGMDGGETALVGLAGAGILAWVVPMIF